MENNNLTIYNPNSEDSNDTKDKNSDKPQSYLNTSQNDITESESDLGQNGDNGNNNGLVYNRLEEQPLSPTQAICLMTTVPQNIASRSLGDKHTPTRNSLRHSRMIVMNRHGKVPKKYLPYIIRHYKLVKSLKVIMIVLGTVMCLLSVALVLWTPTLSAIDFPYWSAAPVLISGVVGCFFLGFCPRPYPGRSLGCHYHLTKFVSLLTTTVSVMTTTIVLIIGIIHLIYILTASCVPHDSLNTTCVCSVSNSTSSPFNDSYHYEDLTCDDVNYVLKIVIVTVGVLNIIALVLDVMYLCIHWTSRRTYVYTRVPLREGISIIDS